MTAVRKSIAIPAHVAGDVAYARYRHIPGTDKTIFTNDAGRYHLMPRAEFDKLVRGELPADSSQIAGLAEGGFLKSQPKIDVLADRLRDRRGYLMIGTSLHIMIITLRCDQICGYCHASRTNLDQEGFDMSEETAKKIVDRIFETSSPSITIEFQGGEPTTNWPVLQFIVGYARQKNAALKDRDKKDVSFSLVTNMSQMTDERAEWLLDQGVMMCTSLDGPKEVHEWNRHLARGSSYDEVTKWIREINRRHAERGRDPGAVYVNALLTVTRATLGADPKAVVDEYVKLGLKSIHFRPLNPFGFAGKTWQRIGYSADEYLAWYRRAVDYVIELNQQGVEILEKKSALYLQKMITDSDPNYMELRSPCGAGVGQLAYNFDGKVYTCDEGRMLGRMGEQIFEVGDIGAGDGYRDFIAHPSVRAMAAASYLDAVPGCSDCAYNPYCGVCPIYNYVEQGDLFGKMPGSDWCKISMGVCDYLFEKLGAGEEMRKVLERWTMDKDRAAAHCAKPGTSMTY